MRARPAGMLQLLLLLLKFIMLLLHGLSQRC
jgi:hypothetical protein